MVDDADMFLCNEKKVSPFQIANNALGPYVNMELTHADLHTRTRDTAYVTVVQHHHCPKSLFSLIVVSLVVPDPYSTQMHPVATSEDLVPLIFSFLPPSAYVACSLVSCLWEISSRPLIFQHITVLRGVSFSQCIALFTGPRNLARHVRSCCFHHSIPAYTYIDDNVSIFVQYILSTCSNLLALTFWDVPIEGVGFSLLPPTCGVWILTFQNCTWDYGALYCLLHCCVGTQLLQVCNSPLFRNDRVFHRENLPRWRALTPHDGEALSKAAPSSILVQSPRQDLSDTFWRLLRDEVDVTSLRNLKLLPHINDVKHANELIITSFPTLKRLETTLIRKVLQHDEYF